MEWYLFFGHIVGAYLLQNSWMAYNKKVDNLPCLAHCVAYTMSVSLFLIACPDIHTVPVSLNSLIFISSWIFSRYEILDHWFELLQIRSWNSIDADLDDTILVHQSVSMSFGTIQYVVANDALQLFVLWVALQAYF